MDFSILDLDAMLNNSLDTVDDIPDYVTPPTGNYKLGIADAVLEKLEAKGTKPASARFILTYKVEATVEVKDALPVADGSLFSERFTYSEEGLKYFKRQAKNLLQVESLEGVNIGEILAALKESPVIDCLVTTTVTPANPTATPPTPEYTNTRVRALPSEEKAA